jgi:hypothetical protein
LAGEATPQISTTANLHVFETPSIKTNNINNNKQSAWAPVLQILSSGVRSLRILKASARNALISMKDCTSRFHPSRSFVDASLQLVILEALFPDHFSEFS